MSRAPHKNPSISLGSGKLLSKDSLFLIAGPCVIESEDLCFFVAEQLLNLEKRLSIPVIFKSSYDKANRTSGFSYRGPGLEKGLGVLKKVKQRFGLPVMTDVHSVEQVAYAAEVVDMLQIPAFLCRQTDLITAAAKTGKAINIKKGQFASTVVMKGAVEKVRSTGNKNVIVTERGTTFGYDDLVVDMRNIESLSSLDVLVVFDATHSVQSPAGLGDRSGGERRYI
ncbi:MAG: 3-deoxy-8-phosphooctulonate synthase, partial [Planctomycetota bacterium]|nr:3-deoxy-8-phosphooctulonate synthase [Planctomycetota bacterium]